MGRRPDWVDDELYPFEDHWIDLDGHELHYLDEGQGPTLLFLHGNPTWSFLYRHVITALRDSFRCIAPDYPGFGLSTAAWNYDGAPSSHAAVIERFILELELQDVVPVVHDWGGPIGFAVAGRHPDRITGAVVTNTWAWPIGEDPWIATFSVLAGNPVSRVLIRRGNLFVNAALPVATTRKLPREVMQHYRAPFARPENRRFTSRLPRDLRRASELQREAARSLMSLSNLPTLIVWGEKDPAFRPRIRERFERSFTDHRTWVLEDASHYLQEDAPQDLATAIREWYGARLTSA